MPRRTHAYGFEIKVAAFVGELCARIPAGESLRPFILKLDRAGSVTSLRFDDGTQEWRSQAERRLGGSYLFYDPLDDWKGYVWVSREGVGRDVMERMIGRRFKEAHFNPSRTSRVGQGR